MTGETKYWYPPLVDERGFIWYVSWGERFIIDWDARREPPSRWQKLKRRAADKYWWYTQGWWDEASQWIADKIERAARSYADWLYSRSSDY